MKPKAPKRVRSKPAPFPSVIRNFADLKRLVAVTKINRAYADKHPSLPPVTFHANMVEDQMVISASAFVPHVVAGDLIQVGTWVTSSRRRRSDAPAA